MNQHNVNLDDNNSVFEIEVNGHTYTVILEYANELKAFHNYLIPKNEFLNRLNAVLKRDLLCKPTETYNFCLFQEVVFEGRPCFVMKSMEVNVYLNELGMIKPTQTEIPVLTFGEFEFLMERDL